MRPYLILLYSLGCLGTTIADLSTASTYAQPQVDENAFPQVERTTVFVLYLIVMCVICLLNLLGGCFLGLRMCISVTLLKNPKDQSLVLLAASWIGSFDHTAEDDDKKKSKLKRRTINVTIAEPPPVSNPSLTPY